MTDAALAADDTRSAAAPPRGAIAFIFITVLINMIGFGVVMPVMPDLVMEVTGVGRGEAARWGGYLTVVYAAMQFVMSPVLGALSDRFGRRPVTLGSLIAYAFDFLLMALAPTFALLFVARAFAGAFAATFTTASAYIADVSPPNKRAANFGLIGAAFGLGCIIGPVVGGLVGDAYGHRAPFFVVAALGAANFLFGLIALPETLAADKRRAFDWRRANVFGNFAQLGKLPSILPIAFSMFLFQIGHWAFPSVWAYYAGVKFGWPPSEIAYSLAAVGLAAAIVQGGGTRLIVPKIGERAAAFLGLAIACFVYPAYGLATAGWMIYALIPIGAFVGLAAPALQGVMSARVPADAQGELQGAIASVNGLSMIVGPIVVTQIFAAFTQAEGPVMIGPFEVSADGAPIYFPGAPYVFAGALAAVSMLPLFGALRGVARADDAVSAGPQPAA
ncbi:MAG: TCR/Tet family MFS transporter [Parvularculaceae bacterium]